MTTSIPIDIYDFDFDFEKNTKKKECCSHCEKEIPNNCIYCPWCGFKVKNAVFESLTLRKTTHQLCNRCGVCYMECEHKNCWSCGYSIHFRPSNL
jgi:hypothetical protein